MIRALFYRQEYFPAFVLLWAMIGTIVLERPAPFVLIFGLAATLIVANLRQDKSAIPEFKQGWKDSSPGSRWLMASIFVLAVLAITSTLWALDPSHTLVKSIRHMAIVLAGIGFLLVSRLPYDRHAAIILLSGGLIANAILLAALLLRLVPEGEYLSYYNRGTLIAVYAVFAAYHFLSAPDVPPALARFGKIALLLSTASVLIISDSQTAQLVALIIVTISLFNWMLARRGLGSALSIAVFLIVMFIGGIWLLWITSIGHAQLEWMADRANIYERLQIWKSFSMVAVEKPFFGWGMKASLSLDNTLMQGLHPALANKWLDFIHPHNGLVQIGLEFGIVGLAFVATGMVSAILSLRTLSPQQRQYALPITAAMIITFLISHGAWQSWWVAIIFCLFAILPTDNSKVTT